MIIGFIGAGNIGRAIAENAIRAGHDVVLANSRGPETLADLVTELGSQARAATAAQAGAAGDIVVVTVPFKSVPDVPVEPLAGKTVLDTNNYYFERDGHFADIDEGRTSPSEVLQQHLSTSRVVKVFNQITSADLAAGGAGTRGPRAIPLAGDDDAAKQTVVDLVRSFGFEAVDAGALSEGYRFDRDRPAYGLDANADDLREALAKA